MRISKLINISYKNRMSSEKVDFIVCTKLRKGHHLVMNESHPCRIADICISAPGKHGHAKHVITGIDIFTGSKYVHTFASHENVKIPVIETSNYQLIDIDQDGFLYLLDDLGNEVNEYNLPSDDLGQDIKSKFDQGKDLTITIRSAMGQSKVIACKNE